MTKTNKTQSKAQLLSDLAASIRNEDHSFNMNYYVVPGKQPAYEKNGSPLPPSCYTAGCMAGHLEAIRPELAEQALQQLIAASVHPTDVDHSHIARRIWHWETGELHCPLDFMGRNAISKCLDDLTREDVLLHLYDNHPDWKQL